MTDDLNETSIEVKPKGKPGRKPGKKVAPPPDNSMVEILMAKFQELMQQNSDNTIALAEALRKPTELEQKKLDEERDARIKRHAMSVEIAQRKQGMDAALQAQCRSEGHANPNGGTRFRAQVNSDGFFVPVCLKCHIQLPKVKATADEIQNGVMLGQYKNLTEDALINLSKYRSQQVA